MLAVIEYINLCTDSLGGNVELVEGAVAGSVHFPFMIDLLSHLQAMLD